MSASTRLGFLFAVAANAIWGLFPIYWNLLQGIPSEELVGHRILWAFLFSVLILGLRIRFGRQATWQKLTAAMKDRRTWAMYSVSAVLIALNWGAFLYAVTHDQVLLSSLGYYINPLFNVLLGVIVLKERLSPARWTAIGLAAVGVSIMAIAAGQVPWVSLIMATSFAGYALVKKKAPLDAMNGLFMELAILVLPTICVMALMHRSGGGVFVDRGSTTLALLVMGGLVTLVPLALFSAATQRIPLTMVGVLQYVGPTLQFLVGAFYFDEPLTKSTLLGFAFVWTGIVFFLSSGLRGTRRLTPTPQTLDPKGT